MQKDVAVCIMTCGREQTADFGYVTIVSAIVQPSDITAKHAKPLKFVSAQHVCDNRTLCELHQGHDKHQHKTHLLPRHIPTNQRNGKTMDQVRHHEDNRTNKNITHFMWFCEERERIRRAYEAGEPRPYTDDPILHRHKFTNIDRRHDRGTKRLYIIATEGYEHEDSRYGAKFSPEYLRRAVYASVLYRFTGSNPHQQGMMEDNPLERWYELAHQVRPTISVKSYQANWPAGKGSGPVG